MSRAVPARSVGGRYAAERVALVCGVAGLGAVTADALALRGGLTLACARGRLLALEREGLLARTRPLAAEPALYTATRSGVRACGRPGVGPCRVTAGSAQHAIAAAAAAVTLERRYAPMRVEGEPELRAREREHGAPLASASLGDGPRGEPLLHRPDLGSPSPSRLSSRSRRHGAFTRSAARGRAAGSWRASCMSPRPPPSARSPAPSRKRVRSSGSRWYR